MDPEKIGKFICELRKEKNLSQYQLADMIPISRQGVSKWERGVTTPDTPTLIILSELFDVSIDELLRGERRETHTIQDLEETTLSILEQSNKKTKTIKRITLISTIIITILLLAFLSYYFINSYNSIEVYKIGNTNDKFTTTDGIFIVTREKYYLKLGNIKNKINAEINNIKLIYKKDNKNILIVEDNDIDNIMIIDSYGYGEKFSKEDIKKIKDKLYIEITYNETEKETFRLRYKRKYNNSSLFFLNQKNGKEKEITIKVEKPVEEKKEEVKEEPKQDTQEENKTETKAVIKEEPKLDPKPEPPKEEVITNEQIISKIKENCIQDLDSYACEYSNIVLFYYETTNMITVLKDDESYIEYDVVNDRCSILNHNCKEEFNKIIKENLFS